LPRFKQHAIPRINQKIDGAAVAKLPTA